MSRTRGPKPRMGEKGRRWRRALVALAVVVPATAMAPATGAGATGAGATGAGATGAGAPGAGATGAGATGAGAPGAGAPGAASSVGNDISWPQCGGAYPAPPAFGIVGVNDGRPYTTNPCLVSEYQWAQRSGAVEFYINTANPDVAASDAYTYGFDGARDAYAYATAHVSAGPGHQWWLDVETGNSWSADQGANTTVIAGAIAFFRTRGVAVGIYSTRYQWGVITGGARMSSVPNWVPGAQSAAAAPSFCTAQRSFSGGPVVMVQYTTRFDYDVLCPGMSPPSPGPALPPPAVAIRNLLNALLAWINKL